MILYLHLQYVRHHLSYVLLTYAGPKYFTHVSKITTRHTRKLSIADATLSLLSMHCIEYHLQHVIYTYH